MRTSYKIPFRYNPPPPPPFLSTLKHCHFLFISELTLQHAIAVAVFLQDCLLRAKKERITALPYIRKHFHLRCYAGYFSSSMPTFRVNQSSPSWNFKHFKKFFPSPKVMESKNSNWNVWTSRKRPIDCLETSAKNYQITLHNIPEEQMALLLGGRSLVSRICSNANIFW